MRPNLNEPDEPQSTQVGITDCDKPVIIGLYGITGSGKTFWLDKIKTALGNDNFAFYDGSDIIAAVTPGGLEAFQNLTEEAKNSYRECAIARIKQECCNIRKTAIVAGHLMFWPEEDHAGKSVYTPSDLDTYTHILYLDVPAEVIAEYRFHGAKRSRPSTSISHLAKWQTFVIGELRHLCRHHNILFTLVSLPLASVSKLGCIVRDFRTHSEGYNKNLAEQRMGEILADSDRLETVIVLDADKTLAQEDSGVLFWEQVRAASAEDESNTPLKALFSRCLAVPWDIVTLPSVRQHCCMKRLLGMWNLRPVARMCHH